jgi:hypothetical protein
MLDFYFWFIWLFQGRFSMRATKVSSTCWFIKLSLSRTYKRLPPDISIFQSIIFWPLLFMFAIVSEPWHFTLVTGHLFLDRIERLQPYHKWSSLYTCVPPTVFFSRVSKFLSMTKKNTSL